MARRYASAWPEIATAALSVTALFSACFAFLSLLPQSTRMGMSDGLWLWRTLIGGPKTDVTLAQSVLWGSSVSGLRPREWNPELVERAFAGPPTPMSRWLEYNWHADHGRIREAEQAIEWHFRQDLPEVDLAIWWFEAAWFEAFSKGDVTAAKARLEVAERFPHDPTLDCSLWKARAAIAACEGRRQEAAEAVAKAEDALGHMAHDEGLRKGTREDLHALLDPGWPCRR